MYNQIYPNTSLELVLILQSFHYSITFQDILQKNNLSRHKGEINKKEIFCWISCEV